MWFVTVCVTTELVMGVVQESYHPFYLLIRLSYYVIPYMTSSQKLYNILRSILLLIKVNPIFVFLEESFVKSFYHKFGLEFLTHSLTVHLSPPSPFP